MKKKATTRQAKATRRQPTLNFPTSSEADLVAESAAETSMKSGTKNRGKRTADFADDADKRNEFHCDSSAISAQSAVKTARGSKGQGTNAEHPSWSNVPLSDLVHSIDQGWSPRCENHAASSHSEWAVIRTTAIQNLQFLDQENKALPSTLQPRKHLELRPGDLLITRAGPRNRVGVACLVRSTRPRLMLCDKAYRLKCRLDVVEPAFLELALNSPDVVSQVNKLKTGINDSGVNITQTPFMNLEIPVPPIAEQHRIVAEIEKQFTRLDAGVAALKRVQANLKRYRAAVLKAACEGKLVPTEAELARQQGRTYETGEQLLQRILTERRTKWEEDQVSRFVAEQRPPKNDKWKKRYKEADAPETNSLPALPQGWVWVELGQLAWSVKDGPHYSPKYAAEGVPFISGGNVRSSGVDFENAKRITPELHAELCKRCKPEVGDILYTKGGTTGIARVNTYTEEFNVWVHVAVLKLVDSVDRFYVQHALNSPLCYAQAQRFTHGVGNQDLGLTRMIRITFGLPPLAEQIRIVAEVERRLSVVDELEAVVSANLQRAARLRQSILQKAFTGELS
jgi:type I restriction enzyme S subunit